MKEQLISLKTAKLAKKKGFNISTKSFYGCDDPVTGPNNMLITIDSVVEGLIRSQEKTLIYNAPTQNMLQTWLRKTYRIHVEVLWLDTLASIYVFQILTTGNAIRPQSKHFYSYEEALEQGLYEALELIEEKE